MLSTALIDDRVPDCDFVSLRFYLGEFRFRDGALWWATALETWTVLLKARAVIVQS